MNLHLNFMESKTKNILEIKRSLNEGQKIIISDTIRCQYF